MSFSDALAYMTNTSNPTADAAQGLAGHLVAEICSLTHNQPAAVCSAVPTALETGQASSANQGSSNGG